MSDEIQRLRARLNETGSLTDARALREAQRGTRALSDEELKEMAVDALASSAGLWKFFNQMLISGRDIKIEVVEREYSAEELAEHGIGIVDFRLRGK